MDDVISKRDAIDAECEVCQIAPKRERGHNCTYYAHGCKEIECIRALPSAQPEREKGKWIPVTNGRGGHECDRCHEYAPSYQTGEEHLSDYCPNCGADMRGEEYEAD